MGTMLTSQTKSYLQHIFGTFSDIFFSLMKASHVLVVLVLDSCMSTTSHNEMIKSLLVASCPDS